MFTKLIPQDDLVARMVEADFNRMDNIFVNNIITFLREKKVPFTGEIVSKYVEIAWGGYCQLN